MSRPNRVKEYNFSYTDGTASSAEAIDTYTTYPLNGMLKGVAIYENNYSGAGSLFIRASGIETTAWSMISGTARGIGINASGLTLPLAIPVRTNSTYISGTATAQHDEIPMNSVMHLVGTKVGDTKSGAIAIVYV